ncbi:MAG: hypothetical protein OHK005_20250 [Candidatus Methylacidiphilales bacterium]
MREHEKAAMPVSQEIKEATVLVERLQVVVAEYLRPSHSMGLKVEGGEVAGIIRQLAERTARGEGVPEFAPTPEGYFLQGLYEELAQERGGIFEKGTDENGQEVFRPISADNWQMALDLLAAKLR